MVEQKRQNDYKSLQIDKNRGKTKRGPGEGQLKYLSQFNMERKELQDDTAGGVVACKRRDEEKTLPRHKMRNPEMRKDRKRWINACLSCLQVRDHIRNMKLLLKLI